MSVVACGVADAVAASVGGGVPVLVLGGGLLLVVVVVVMMLLCEVGGVGDVVCGCVQVCVFLSGRLPRVRVGGVGVLVVCCLGGALHRCGLVVWGCCPTVGHTYS